jgi:Uma2 family endonuclease
MHQLAERPRMMPGDYLAWERLQSDKHEYHLGEVRLMAGGSVRHNYLAAAILAELRSTLRAQGCSVMTSDQRVAAPRGERYVYPDATVVCGAVVLEEGTTDVLVNPTIVVEVLSPSTERYDRGPKWLAYQALPCLTDYVLVSQDEALVEHYARAEGGVFQYRAHGPGGTLVLSNGASMAVDAIYAGAFELPGA